MQTIYEFVSYAGPAILGLLGVIVTFWSPRPNTRWKWVLAFALIFLCTALSHYLDSRAEKAETSAYRKEIKKQQKQIADSTKRLEKLSNKQIKSTTGGENYAYIWIDGEIEKDKGGKWPVWISPTGLLYDLNVWIAPWPVKDYKDKRYRSIGGFRYTVLSGGVVTNMRLHAGKYRIEFTGRNGSWIQHLDINETKGIITQCIEVFRDGQRIFSKGCDAIR